MTNWVSETVEDCLVPLSLGRMTKLQTRDYQASGAYPIVDQGQGLIAGWTDDVQSVIAAPLPVIVFGDHTRAFKYIDFPFARGADGTQILKPRDDIDPLFFYYACRAINLPSRGYNRHFTLLKEQIISRPRDTVEQSHIGSLLRQIESGTDRQTKQLAETEKLKHAAMRELFTRGLRGETQKETDIGLVPASWRPRTLLELSEILSGGTPRKSVAEYWIGEIPWASGKDLKVPTLHDTIDHISESGVEAGSRLAPADTVFILVRGMGLAKDLPISVISRPMAFNQDLKALVTRGELSGTYIRSAIYCAKDRLLSRIVPSAHGTMTLNLDDIETFKIPCPAEDGEAKEIVTILDALDRKIDLHKRKRVVLDVLFKVLLQKLMMGEIRITDFDQSALAGAVNAEAAA